MSKDTLPAKGGSYIKDKKGDLKQVAKTEQLSAIKPKADPAPEAPSKDD